MGLYAEAHSHMPRAFTPFLQELSLDCRPGLAFSPGAFVLLGRGGLRSLTLSCDSLGADTPQHLGCLTGLTQLQMFGSPHNPLEVEGGAVLRHLTALSGLTQLAHLQVELGRGTGDLPPASELLAALPRAPLEKVGRPGQAAPETIKHVYLPGAPLEGRWCGCGGYGLLAHATTPRTGSLAHSAINSLTYPPIYSQRPRLPTT
jgi:hypothetical protein